MKLANYSDSDEEKDDELNKSDKFSPKREESLKLNNLVKDNFDEIVWH